VAAANVNSETGTLMPGIVGVKSKPNGGGGFCYLSMDGTDEISQISKSKFKGMLNILRTGDNHIAMDTSSGTPCLKASDANTVRTEMYLGILEHKKLMREKRTGMAEWSVSARRARTKSSSLMMAPVAELDILFKNDPQLFHDVSRFKTYFGLSHADLRYCYSASISPHNFVHKVRQILSAADNNIVIDSKDILLKFAESTLRKRKDNSTIELKENNNKLKTDIVKVKQAIPISSQVCKKCGRQEILDINNPKLKNLKLCAWCDVITPSSTIKCIECRSNNTIVFNNTVACTSCNHVFSLPNKGDDDDNLDMDQREAEVYNLQQINSDETENNSESNNIDEPHSEQQNHVSWGCVEHINFCDNVTEEECENLEGSSLLEESPPDDPDNNTCMPCLDQPHESIDTLIDSMAADVSLVQLCKSNRSVLLNGWKINHGARVRQIMCRAVLTRSKSPIQFDPHSTHLDDATAHDLNHTPHDPNCLACKHGRHLLAPMVRGGASKPDPSGEVAYLTFDWIGPWSTSSCGHRWIAAISWYRPNETTPLLFTASCSSKNDGVSAVMLHRARTFWHIEDRPFTLHCDLEGVLNDAFMQRYVALAILPSNQLWCHARQSKNAPINFSHHDITEQGVIDTAEDVDINSIDEKVYRSIFPSEIDLDSEYVPVIYNASYCKLEPGMYKKTKACAGKIGAVDLSYRPRGRPPADAVWDSKTRMYYFKPKNDCDVKKTRGRPANGVHFVDGIGYTRPIDPHMHQCVRAEGLGQIRNGLPYVSNTNSRAERSVRLISEQVRAITSASGFKSDWWHLSCNALPTLSLTSRNRELKDQKNEYIQPGAYTGPVVPLGTLGVCKLPHKLRKKSDAHLPSVCNVVCAGYNSRSSLGVKVLYKGTNKLGKTVMRTSYISARNVSWKTGCYPLEKSLDKIEEISLMSKSVLISMGYELPYQKSSRHFGHTLIKCSDPKCNKWRFISIQKYNDFCEKNPEEKWTCQNCNAPEEKGIYDHFDKTIFRNNVGLNDRCVGIPELIEDPIDEPIMIEMTDEERAEYQVKALCIKSVMMSDKFDNPDPSCTNEGFIHTSDDKVATDVALALARMCKVDGDMLRAIAEKQVKNDEQAYALVVNTNLTMKAKQVLAQAVNCNSNVPVVRARAIICKNKDIFNKENPDYQEWVNALDDELMALVLNGVLRPVLVSEVDKDASVIPAMLVSCKKSCGRKKCRLVACGNFLASDKFDPSQTYAATVNRADVQAMIYWAFSEPEKYSWSSCDIATAFLQTDPDIARADGKKFMLKPPAVCCKHAQKSIECTNVLWEVLSSIYGLRTAPRDWAKTLTMELEKKGFTCTLIDESVLTSIPDPETGERVIIACFVDDINVFGVRTKVESVMKAITTRFKVSAPPLDVTTCTNSDNALMYLAQKFWTEYDKQGQRYLVMSMSKYIEEMLTRHGFEDVKPKISMQDGWFDEKALKGGQALDASRHKIFRGVVAAIGYLTQCQRFDLLTPCNILQSELANPHEGAWSAMVHLLGYIVHTRERRLEVPIGESWSKGIEVVTFSDANFTMDGAPRGGSIICLRVVGSENYLPLTWRSSRQRCIALSTTEAELCELTLSVKSSLSIVRMIREWCPVEIKNIRLLGDNQAANAISRGSCTTRKVRHLLLNSLFVKELFSNPSKYDSPPVIIDYIATLRNCADCMTKVLHENVLCPLLRIVNMVWPGTNTA